MPYKVFISHSSRDTWVAEQIEKYAKICGADTFLDERHIIGGDKFDEIIRQELNTSDELVVLLTPWAIERPYIWIEVGVIWGRGQRIVAVLHGKNLTEIQSDPKIAPQIKQTDILDINELERYFDELKIRVQNS